MADQREQQRMNVAKAPAHSCPHVWGRWEAVTSKLEQRQCTRCGATEMRTK